MGERRRGMNWTIGFIIIGVILVILAIVGWFVWGYSEESKA
jgi:heme/copper-type cytochrome/quinol oxidase subunit 2